MSKKAKQQCVSSEKEDDSLGRKLSYVWAVKPSKQCLSLGTFIIVLFIEMMNFVGACSCCY